MPFPNTFLRLTLAWQLPGGEVAQSSCSWDPSSPLVSLDGPTSVLLSGRASTFWGAIKGAFPSSVQYVGSKVSWVSTTNHVLASIDHTISPVNGTGDNPMLPSEVACVVSLRTAFAGRRFRGRMYLPPPSAGATTAVGRYTSTLQGIIAPAAATMLAPLVSGAETFTSVVASATGAVMSPIIEVGVGDVPDVQRRRRDSLHEVYVNQGV